MELDRIQNTPKISEMVLESIFNAISEGRIKIGEELPSERELSEMLGVSRGSLRESLAILEFLGIIEPRGKKKVVLRDAGGVQKALSIVRLSNQKDILLDYIEFRKVVETFSAELACLRATPEDIKKMSEAVSDLEKDPENLEADYRFHISLAEASHNAFLAAVEELLISLLDSSRRRAHQLPGRKYEIVEENKRILEAIKLRDVKLAREEMFNHLSKIEDYTKKGIIDTDE